MSVKRIQAVMLQELFITKRSLEVIMDLFFFSIMSVFVFGLVSSFLSKTMVAQSAYYLFLGMILWEVVRVTQYSISVGALWNVWSRNLSNMFITPLTLQEYLVAQMISGFVKAFVIFIIISVIAAAVFNFNVLSIGILNLALHFLNLTVFGWSIGIIILGFIFRFGTRIQALAWGLVFIFQPLTAAFFPLDILPSALQQFASLFPATHVFEAARANLTNPAVRWGEAGIALLENAAYLIFSLWFFGMMFRKSRESGQFAKMEG